MPAPTPNRRARRPRPRRLALAAAALVAIGVTAPEASAARIRPSAKIAEPRPPKPLNIPFAEFLEAGPALWDHATPKVPKGLRIKVDASGQPVPSLFLDYLIYRRELDPSRFDAHHPNIAALVAEAETPAAAALPAVTPAPAPTLVAAPQVTTPTAPLTPPPHQTVPEPGSALVACVLLAAGVVVARRRRLLDPFSDAPGNA